MLHSYSSVKIVKKYHGIEDPILSTPNSGCYDLTVINMPTLVVDWTCSLITNAYLVYKTGLIFEPDSCFDILAFSRSSIRKKNLILCNSVGYIDSDYRGEVELTFKFANINSVYINALKHTLDTGKNLENILDTIYVTGEKFIQIRLIPKNKINFKEVALKDLTETDRGAGGYGSTGK